MLYLARLLAAISGAFFIGGVSAVATPAQAPTPREYPPQNVSYRVSDPFQVRVPATTLPPGECGDMWPLAKKAGWTLAQWPDLNRIMRRESRCQPEAHNTTLNKDKSTDMGLMQVNDRSWCLPTRWYPAGYLQTLGILDYCEQLFDPLTNLRAAKAIYDYAQESSGNGFQPWGG